MVFLQEGSLAFQVHLLWLSIPDDLICYLSIKKINNCATLQRTMPDTVLSEYLLPDLMDWA